MEMNKARFFLITLMPMLFTFINIHSQPEDQKIQTSIYYVLIHSHGKKWVDSLSFNEQPGIINHVKYIRGFLENKKLVLGGPFPDNSGGMMVCNVETMKEAEKIANNDPAVKSGMLNVKVKKWYIAMSNITINQ
jgi:uncharacterized protein YciI